MTLSAIRDAYDAAQGPVKVSANITIHWAQVDLAMWLHQESLRMTRQKLAADLRVLLHLSPAPSGTKALDAIDAAISEIEEIKQALRAAQR